MQSLIDALRQVLGEPNFYIISNDQTISWDYGAMLEYIVGAMILMICVSYVFKFLKWAFCR